MRSSDATTITITITLIPKEHINICPDTNVPQIHFNQMNVMDHQHSAARNDTPAWSDPYNPPHVDDGIIFVGMDRGHIRPQLTRAFLNCKVIGWIGRCQSSSNWTNTMHKACLDHLHADHQDAMYSLSCWRTSLKMMVLRKRDAYVMADYHERVRSLLRTLTMLLLTNPVPVRYGLLQF